MPASPKRDAKGITSKPPRVKKEKAQKLAGLTKGQNAVINQTQAGDLALGNTANRQLEGINSAYSQPFDFDQYKSPAGDDYQGWIDQQMGTYNDAFDARNNKIFKDQAGDFEQQMANRGIPMGSELYNKEKSRLEQSQGDQRQQAYAGNQAQASQAAQGFFDIGSQAQANRYGLAQAGRNAPLNDYNQLMGAQSGMGMQNLGYAQQRGLAEQGGQIARSMPRGGGGGGSGGGVGPFQGFGSIQELWAAQDARARGNQQFDWENNPQYRQPRGPSSSSQLIGGVGGALLGGWAQSGFKGLF